MSTAAYSGFRPDSNLLTSSTTRSQLRASRPTGFSPIARPDAPVVTGPAGPNVWAGSEKENELVVVAGDRLGRSVREVATALHELTTRGIYVRSLSEGVDTSTPTGRAVTSIMATIAELELELGKERRAASREARIARGLAATKPMKLDVAQQKRLLRLYQQGEPVSELISIFGISRSTLFRTLRFLKQREPTPA